MEVSDQLYGNMLCNMGLCLYGTRISSSVVVQAVGQERKGHMSTRDSVR